MAGNKAEEEDGTATRRLLENWSKRNNTRRRQRKAEDKAKDEEEDSEIAKTNWNNTVKARSKRYNIPLPRKIFVDDKET